MIGRARSVLVTGGAEALQEGVYPSGSSLLSGHPGAAPGAAQVSPGTAGLGRTGRGRTSPSFTVPLPFPRFLVPVPSAAEFREEISACVVLQEEAVLGTPLLWGGRSEVTRRLSAALPQLFCFWSREFERKQ